MVAVEGPATIPGYGDSFPIAQAELAALVHCSGFLSCWCIVGKQELGDAERQDHSWRDIPFAHGGGSLCDGLFATAIWRTISCFGRSTPTIRPG